MTSETQPIPAAASGDRSGDRRLQQIIRSTITVVLAFAFTRVVSLAQVFIIAREFGVGPDADAFTAANLIPELIFNLISGGALANAFIPVFSGYLAREDRPGAWKIASHIINTVFIATLVVSLIIALIAPWVVRTFVASGFTPDQVTLTANLMRVLLVGTVIFSVSGILMGILQSHQRFLLPALAPIMYDIGILAGVLFLLPTLGVYGVALGAVAGAALHLGIQLPGLFQIRARWMPQFGWNDRDLWRVIRLMLPNVAALALFNINFLVMTNIASRLGTGAVSSFGWGWRLMQIPQTLIGTAMATVIFPTLSALSALNDAKGKRESMSGALRFILIGTIPSAVGLIFVGRPLISLLERGAFDASASALVYSALQFFALGIIVHSALEIVASSFYADKDTLTPLMVRVGGTVINVSLAYVLSGVAAADFAYTNGLLPRLGFRPLLAEVQPLSVGMLAFANSLAIAFEVAVLLVILRRRWHSINENALARTLWKTLLASLIMALAITLISFLWDMLGLNNGRLIYTLALIGLEVGIAALVFFGAAWALKMEELNLIPYILRARRKAAPA
ncbi:MAG: murein biosynthesis integral membrane protein MurJ [bacterium]|nr:murein biosynthesis integral membrane protein MurJ [bacterium]